MRRNTSSGLEVWSVMKPAYHIGLSPAQLRTLGRLCATQGQIEWSMQKTVQRLLDISSSATRDLMGSTNIASISAVYEAVVREKLDDEVGLSWALYLTRELKDLASARNSFVHAIYGTTLPTDEEPDRWVLYDSKYRTSLKGRGTVAVRLRNNQPRNPDELVAAEKKAAYLSCVASHVMTFTWPDGVPSPWRRKLGGLYPPPQPAPAKRT